MTNLGGEEKKRNSREKKLGRPRTTTPGNGVIIDAEVERMFRTVLDQYYLSEKKQSLAFAHRRFEDMYEISHRRIDKEDYPTLAQLRYFYEREYTNEGCDAKTSWQNTFSQRYPPIA
jgi:hypothetical protein